MHSGSGRAQVDSGVEDAGLVKVVTTATDRALVNCGAARASAPRFCFPICNTECGPVLSRKRSAAHRLCAMLQRRGGLDQKMIEGLELTFSNRGVIR